MTELLQLLDEADSVIDGEMNCHTPEYRAIDLLRTVLRRIVVVEKLRAAVAAAEQEEA